MDSPIWFESGVADYVVDHGDWVIYEINYLNFEKGLKYLTFNI
jgi:hypothetical protein